MGSRLLPALGLGWVPRIPGRQPPDSWVTSPTSLPRWFVGFALVYGIPQGWDCPAGPLPDYPEQGVLEAKAGEEGREGSWRNGLALSLLLPSLVFSSLLHWGPRAGMSVCLGA